MVTEKNRHRKNIYYDFMSTYILLKRPKCNPKYPTINFAKLPYQPKHLSNDVKKPYWLSIVRDQNNLDERHLEKFISNLSDH